MNRRVSLLCSLIVGLAATAFASPAAADDPTTADCLGASELSLKARGARKLREAREQALVCAASSCPADVRTECERRLRDINDAMPTLVFEVKDAAGADLTSVRVTMDGKVIAERIEGAAISLDPGEHAFVFESVSAAGLSTQKTFVLQEGQKNRRETIILKGATGASETLVPAVLPAPLVAPPVTPPPADAPRSSWSTQKTVAIVVGGIGLVGVGLGTVFGLGASSKWNQAKRDCGDGCASDTPAQQEKRDAEGAAIGSTIAFGVGAAGLLVAVVLWATAPSGARAAYAPTTGARAKLVPSIGAGTGGLDLRGAF